MISGQLASAVRSIEGKNAWRPLWTVEDVAELVLLVATLIWLRPAESRAPRTGVASARFFSLRAMPGEGH